MIQNLCFLVALRSYCVTQLEISRIFPPKVILLQLNPQSALFSAHRREQQTQSAHQACHFEWRKSLRFSCQLKAPAACRAVERALLIISSTVDPRLAACACPGCAQCPASPRRRLLPAPCGPWSPWRLQHAAPSSARVSDLRRRQLIMRALAQAHAQGPPRRRLLLASCGTWSL